MSGQAHRKCRSARCPGIVRLRGALRIDCRRAVTFACWYTWITSLVACQPNSLLPSLRLQGQVQFMGRSASERYVTRLSAVLLFGSTAASYVPSYQTTWTVADQETLSALCNQNPLCIQETQMRGNIVVSAVP